MPITHEGLAREFEWVTKPGEQKHIGEAIDPTDPIMQEMAYELIVGNNTDVDRLTKEALDNGYTANQILDDGLLNQFWNARQPEINRQLLRMKQLFD